MALTVAWMLVPKGAGLSISEIPDLPKSGLKTKNYGFGT